MLENKLIIVVSESLANIYVQLLYLDSIRLQAKSITSSTQLKMAEAFGETTLICQICDNCRTGGMN